MMKVAERVVIYPSLLALAALNAVLLLSSSGREALAEASAWLADLGPAESLTLTEGESSTVLRSKAGRVTWGAGDFKHTYSVGFVDISSALNPLMESATFTDEREELRTELEAKEADYRAKLEAIDSELSGMADRQTPQAQERMAEGQKLYDEYMQWGQDALKRRNELDVRHLQQAYRELVNGVNVVADKLGVDIVLRFIPTENDFKATDAQQALTEIRLRTAVRYPNALDITDEVLEEMAVNRSE